MRTAIWIISFTFAIFGVIGWAFQTYSPSYVGLVIFGVVGFLIGWLTPA